MDQRWNTGHCFTISSLLYQTAYLSGSNLYALLLYLLQVSSTGFGSDCFLYQVYVTISYTTSTHVPTLISCSWTGSGVGGGVDRVQAGVEGPHIGPLLCNFWDKSGTRNNSQSGLHFWPVKGVLPTKQLKLV